MNEQPHSVSDAIELRLFLLAPNSFINKIPKTQSLSIDDQKQYLMAVFNQEKDIIRPLLRKNDDSAFLYEVHQGWEYVDTLIRYFRNGISLPREIVRLFSDVPDDDAGVDISGTNKSNKPYSNTDGLYSNMDKYKTFEKFVNAAVVQVDFVK